MLGSFLPPALTLHLTTHSAPVPYPASICYPQCRETKADTLKATEANRRRGPGTREKVNSRRINLEGNTHAQEINVSQLPV
jgi:hypothetical protein